MQVSWSLILVAYMQLAALALALIAIYAWRHRRQVEGALAFSFFSNSVALYTFFAAWELNSSTLSDAMLWTHLQYIGITLLPVFGLQSVLRLAGLWNRPWRRFQALLFVVPVVVLVLKWTDGWHGLVYRQVGLLTVDPVLVLDVVGGPAYWVQVVYQNLLFVICFLVIIRSLLQSTAYSRGQWLLLLLGLLLPWTGHLLYQFRAGGMLIDKAPIGLSLATFVWALAIFRYGLLRLEPITNAHVVRALRNGVVVLDRQGRVLQHNPAAAAMFQQTLADPMGVPMDAYFAQAPGVRQALADGVDEAEVVPDGGVARVVSVRRSLLDAERGLQLLLFADVTERRQLEQRLAAGQRLEAIGQLAGGVAHDFNNFLQPILGHAELALAGEVPEDQYDETFRLIRDSAERSAGLVRQLLDFARRRPMRKERVDLAQAVPDLLEFLTSLLPGRIALEWDGRCARAEVLINRAQLDQVLVNLVLNAKDAMPDGGTIRIRLSEVELADTDPLVAEWSCRSGVGYAVEVVDQGEGISAEVLPRIYEPFFTTKPTGQGSGMGLATVYGILRQNEGGLRVDTRVGQGTVMTVWLPMAAAVKAASVG
jgi:signal transduction histidine kinase